MLQRRDFLRASSLLPFMPALAASAARSPRSVADPILVVVELSGGNDGVNTIVPFRDEGYARHRRKIGLARQELLGLNDDLGLHPGLRGFATLLERGELGVVQGVGYPELELSHEVALANWHTARFDRVGRTGPGWIGRMLDAELDRNGGAPRAPGVPGAILAGPHTLPGALRTRKSPVATIPSLETYLEAAEFGCDPVLNAAAGSPAEERIRRVLLDAHATAQRLRSTLESERAAGHYPATALGASLRLIAQLIRAELQTPVFYCIQPGYDTHALQPPTHDELLRDLGDSVLAFLDDVRAAGQQERVVVLAFSEFGRRAVENASHGTDHGTSGPLFLAGAPIRAGVYGATPSMTDLDDGNLETSVDLRRIYATLLGEWFDEDAEALLGGAFATLPFLRGPS